MTEREFRLRRSLGGVDRLLGLRGFEFGDFVVGYQGAGILRSMLGERVSRVLRFFF